MHYDDIDFHAINKGQSDTKIEIHSVINRWKNETNGQKKKKFSLTTYCIWMEEPIHHFDLKHLQLWLAY